jgi:nicotinamidase-related amidase
MSALLLCIDAYRDPKMSDEFYHNIARVVRHGKQRGLPAVFVTFAVRIRDCNCVMRLGDMDQENQNHVLRDPLFGLPFALTRNDLVALKNGLSAFHATHSFAAKHAVRQVILTGQAEGMCIAFTAKDYARHGYDVAIAAEATDSGVSDHWTIEQREAFFRDDPIRIAPSQVLFEEIDAHGAFTPAPRLPHHVPIVASKDRPRMVRRWNFIFGIGDK